MSRNLFPGQSSVYKQVINCIEREAGRVVSQITDINILNIQVSEVISTVYTMSIYYLALCWIYKLVGDARANGKLSQAIVFFVLCLDHSPTIQALISNLH